MNGVTSNEQATQKNFTEKSDQITRYSEFLFVWSANTVGAMTLYLNC